MNDATNLVSIIILNYNSGKLLSNCVRSIYESNFKNYEIIVVDNASHDQSETECKEKFPDIKLIKNEKNLGFCEGNNIGIKAAKGNFIIILNPDTEVDNECFSNLLKAYEEYGVGLYQPKLLALQDKMKINSAGNRIQIFGFGYSRGKGEIDNESYNKVKIISYPSGACLFTTKKTLENIGNFESFLFAFHDDLDLGWRAAKLGIKSFYIPSAIVYHMESYNWKWSPKKFYYLERNRHYCLLVHYSKDTFYKILPHLILVEFAIFFFYLSKGLLKEKIKAWVNIIKNRKYISKRYQELEKIRKIPDSEIIKEFEDEIIVPPEVAGSFMNKSFNKFLLKLSKAARTRISKS